MYARRFFLLSIIFSFLIFSCKEESSALLNDGTITLQNADKSIQYLEEKTQTWHQTNKRICILYGYGYNLPEFISQMNEYFFSEYGSAEEEGMILSLVFPDDFKRGNRVYITNLTDMLSDYEIQGIVLLGAPEGTHIALARMQDSFGGSLPFPVFSLFPQDNVLGMEDSSDFVLDKAQQAEINGIIQEEEQSFVDEIPEILKNCVRYISYSDGSFEKNAKLYESVKKICGNSKVERFCDPDTGLISINHFVLE